MLMKEFKQLTLGERGETTKIRSNHRTGLQIRKNFNETAFFFPDLTYRFNRCHRILIHHARSIDPVEIPGHNAYQGRRIWIRKQRDRHAKRVDGST